MDFHVPLKLVQNKVRAEGGREIDRLRGVEPAKDTPNGAEAWIGSVTRANGATKEHPNLGCAEVLLPDGEKRYLFELVNDYPADILGRRHMEKYGSGLGMLIKMLDAKKQFLLQCHPTRADAKKFWNSDYGKEECWYIISIREDVEEPPYILLGFKEGANREEFENRFYHDSLDSLEAMCNKLIVKPGEAYLIPGGVPHALGVGCFVAEIQEPSDLTAVPITQDELLAFRRRANPLGVFTAEDNELYETRMLNSFIFDTGDEAYVRAKYQSRMGRIRSEGDSEELEIFGGGDTDCFSTTMVNVKGSISRKDTGDVQIGLVLRGEGSIRTGEGSLDIKQGDEIFFPYGVKNASFVGDFSIILCNPGLTAQYK